MVQELHPPTAKQSSTIAAATGGEKKKVIAGNLLTSTRQLILNIIKLQIKFAVHEGKKNEFN